MRETDPVKCPVSPIPRIRDLIEGTNVTDVRSQPRAGARQGSFPGRDQDPAGTPDRVQGTGILKEMSGKKKV
jgi:hypothetical protein